MCRSHIRNGSYASLSQGRGVYISSLEFYKGHLSLLHLFIHLIIYTYGLIDICFTLWIITQYYFVAQIVPVSPIENSFCCCAHLTPPPLLGVCVCMCVPACTCVCFTLPSVLVLQIALGSFFLFLTCLRICYFSKELWFLLLENCIRKHYLDYY